MIVGKAKPIRPTTPAAYVYAGKTQVLNSLSFYLIVFNDKLLAQQAKQLKLST